VLVGELEVLLHGLDVVERAQQRAVGMGSGAAAEPWATAVTSTAVSAACRLAR
jgi:hypothetical protein